MAWRRFRLNPGRVDGVEATPLRALELGVAELRRRAADGVAGLAPVAARVDGRRLGLFGTEPAVWMCRRAFPHAPFSL